MSHLRPLTVTWSSGAVAVGDNLEGLYTEGAAASVPCPPALPPAPWLRGHRVRWLGGRAWWAAPPRQEHSQSPRSAARQPGSCPPSARCLSCVGACGLAFPSFAS